MTKGGWSSGCLSWPTPKVLIRNAKARLTLKGYLPSRSAAAHLLFQLVSRRYDHGSVLITSHRALNDWGTVLGDQVVATATLERPLHHSHMLTIRGDSYRLREKRRLGLLMATAAPASAEATKKRRWLGSQCRPVDTGVKLPRSAV